MHGSMNIKFIDSVLTVSSLGKSQQDNNYINISTNRL
jgi:hypothetical protein